MSVKNQLTHLKMENLHRKLWKSLTTEEMVLEELRRVREFQYENVGRGYRIERTISSLECKLLELILHVEIVDDTFERCEDIQNRGHTHQ